MIKFTKKSIRAVVSHLLKPLLLLTTVLVSLSGCTPARQTRMEYTIGFSQCIGSDAWRESMLKEMKRELSFHPGIRLLYEDAGGNSQTQVAQVRSMLHRNIDLLIISPNEAQPLTPVVEEAFNSGIPVIVIDRKIASGLYTAYVGGNNFEIGRLAAEYVAAKLNKKGKIVEVMGLPGSSPAIERQRGFYKGLRQYPQIQIIKQVYGNWLKNEAEHEVNKIAAACSGADFLFAHNDQMALGSWQALQKHIPGNKIKIVGVDALPGENNGLRYIADHILYASMLYPTGGQEAIRTAVSILSHQPFEKENILKTLVVDSGNVQLMKMQADKLNSQQADIERQQRMLEEQQQVYHNQQVILNILVISLVLAIIFGGIAFYSLNENWKNNKTLEARNEEIMSQQQQLIEMSSKAEAASEARANFFTSISHEFRTPLTLILSPLEDLLSDNKISPPVRRHLQLISKNVNRLLRIVNQLIDFRKIEYDKMQITVTGNDLTAFVKDITGSFKEIARKRNIDFRLLAPPKELLLWYDSNMLDKVIYNLLSNAFKFTHDHGKITVHIREKQDDGVVEITVEDNGPGMSEEAAEHAFDLFYQGDTGRAQGSGIGLALSKEIIALHKGEISVTSRKWQGASFKIMLPLGKAHLPDKVIAPLSNPCTPNPANAKLYISDVEEPFRQKLREEEKEKGIIRDHSILIIEDNEDLLGFLRQKLSGSFEVYTATDGTAGLNEAIEKVPDLIVSDIIMPGMSGTQLSLALKNDIRTSHIPIILLTAQVSPEHQIEGVKAMADAYVTKPFNILFLQETIKNLLSNRRLLRSHYTGELPLDSRAIPSGRLDKKFLNGLSAIVENNLANENLSVEDICRNLGISRVQLYRKVKALTGTSVSEYIIHKRLQKAKYLLLNEELTISEITYQVGISSPTYFSTLFKNKYGCTPSEFRKKRTAESIHT